MIAQTPKNVFDWNEVEGCGLCVSPLWDALWRSPKSLGLLTEDCVLGGEKCRLG